MNAEKLKVIREKLIASKPQNPNYSISSDSNLLMVSRKITDNVTMLIV